MNLITRRKVLGAGLGVIPFLVIPAHRLDWDRLAGILHGTLVRPGDPRYPVARQLDQVRFDAVAPRAVAYCVDDHDVALCLRFAEHHGLLFAVRSGGHSYGGYSTSPGLVIDVSRLNAVVPGPGVVRVGPGAQMVDLLNALAPSGLVIPGGVWATVAAGGFVQGGGVGYLTRPLGLACDRLVAARVVLASGHTVTAFADEHPDLYWALRGGGGGNFGVVTSFSMRPAALVDVSVASLTWPWDKAVDMLDGFAHWLPGAPSSVGAIAVAVLKDAAPVVPPLAGVVLLSTGQPDRLAAETARLIDCCGAPATRYDATYSHQSFMTSTFGCGSIPTDLCHRIPQGAFPRPAYGVVRGRYFTRPMPCLAWESALAAFDTARLPGQTHKLEVLGVGGAVADLGRRDTAFVHRDASYNVNALSVIQTDIALDQEITAARRWTDAVFTAVDPYSNGESYQNFTDPALTDWRHAYYAENYPRLAAVKREYDPHRAFRFPQAV